MTGEARPLTEDEKKQLEDERARTEDELDNYRHRLEALVDERTADAFDDDGWFVSGDLGSITDEGDLVLAGRVGDMYIRGGFNVHPVEVDHVLAEHPGVKEAAVVGYPTPVIGEIGVAFVVPSDASSPPSGPCRITPRAARIWRTAFAVSSATVEMSCLILTYAMSPLSRHICIACIHGAMSGFIAPQGFGPGP